MDYGLSYCDARSFVCHNIFESTIFKLLMHCIVYLLTVMRIIILYPLLFLFFVERQREGKTGEECVRVMSHDGLYSCGTTTNNNLTLHYIS